MWQMSDWRFCPCRRRLQDASALFQKALGSVFSISRLSVEAHTREKVLPLRLGGEAGLAEFQETCSLVFHSVSERKQRLLFV
jgi:hypothetical protein